MVYHEHFCIAIPMTICCPLYLIIPKSVANVRRVLTSYNYYCVVLFLFYLGKSRRKEMAAHTALPNRLKELEKPDQVTLTLQVETLHSQLSDQER